MKKPTIKNWIKYCAGTLAVSGMLLTTSCDSGNQTADYENEVEAAENESVVLERENVNDPIEVGEEEGTDADDRQTVGGANDVDYASTATTENQNQQASNMSSTPAAAAMPDMDVHLEEYKDPNQAIREELTDSNDQVGDQSMDRQNVNNTQMDNTQSSAMTQDTASDADMNSYQYNTDQQGRENVSNTDADRAEQEATIISLYEIDMDRLNEEDRQRVSDMMNEYKERRDRERGQMNPETGAYISPEVDARPKMGYEELMETVTDKIEYPNNALAAQMEGTVIVNFVVDENGEVLGGKAVEYITVPTEEMQYTQPLNPTKFSEQEVEDTKKEMMKAAVEAITATSGQWEAAMQNGETVPAEVQLPVRFRIPSSDTVGDGDY